MMKCLFFLLFVAACQAYVARVAEQIPTPRVTRFETFRRVDDNSLLLEWSPVENPEILGYRMTVWDQGTVVSDDQSNIHGEVVVDASTKSASVGGLQLDTWYLARVQAFTRTATSEWSNRRWVMLHSPIWPHGRQSYTVME
ncbi:protein sidekick-1-like [Ostrinia nubilalis]|uniref:protein sidekick-1-like n=1 Tax=Ostrinia nubilalis TaxID=29057 RepID=UPI0030822EC3